MKRKGRKAAGGPTGSGGGRSAAAKRRTQRRVVTVQARPARGGRGVGVGVGVCLVEAVGGRMEVITATREIFPAKSSGGGGADEAAARAGQRFARGGDWKRAAEALGAAGHVDRLKILGRLLEGPATYRALQKATGLGAGPLYHHIDTLRLAGLLTPKQRDLYALSRAGRNLVLVARVVGGLVRDRRPRPQPEP